MTLTRIVHDLAAPCASQDGHIKVSEATSLSCRFAPAPGLKSEIEGSSWATWRYHRTASQIEMEMMNNPNPKDGHDEKSLFTTQVIMIIFAFILNALLIGWVISNKPDF